MSLDNFQLPPFLAGELYKDSLVDLDSNQLKNKSLKGGEPAFLGNNSQNILLLINEENTPFLADDDLNFLVGILTACRLTLADTALINIHKNPGITYKAILQHFKPGVIICFDINLASLEFPLAFPEYQVQQYNRQSYLAAPSLKKLAADKQEKIRLWACLKKIFSI